ncbi:MULTISPECIES: serine O-acetyltransferase [Aliagarivorans]|uniref:serine O-acetyltransferase n=1 Tax=Aliagarivorans TaxID=882379 RepID=UPI000552AD61|nr:MULTISPECIES: serine O-acetyltransferase [Aliagarivorans]
MTETVWLQIRDEARRMAEDEPMLASFFYSTILNHETLPCALSFQLASKLDSTTVPAILLREFIEEAFVEEPEMLAAVAADIVAVKDRDPAVQYYAIPLLYLKGFHALQGYRVSNWLWRQGRLALARYIQNQISTVFAVDIHPAANIGKGILLDHATGIVIGETAVIEDEVSILQSVTLGGTGKEMGDRHPKIRRGVLIGAGAKILGNIEVGCGAKVGAGSVVLEPVPPHTTVAGVPAKVVGTPSCDMPAIDMGQNI